MVQESIAIEEVLEALAGCELLEEYPDDRRGPSCLVPGDTVLERPLHWYARPSNRSSFSSRSTNLCRPNGLRRLRGGLSHAVQHQGLSGGLRAADDRPYSPQHGNVMVIDHVPAEVCSVCGDTLLSGETVERIQAILRAGETPNRSAPLYEYA